MSDKLSEKMRKNIDADVPTTKIPTAQWVALTNEVAACEQQLEHFERFKLYLEIMGGIDVDHAWEATTLAASSVEVPF